MSSKQTVLDRELFVQALRHMGEEDLLFLNRMVVERLNGNRHRWPLAPSVQSRRVGQYAPMPAQ
jgi:hypothetical protein